MMKSKVPFLFTIVACVVFFLIGFFWSRFQKMYMIQDQEINSIKSKDNFFHYLQDINIYDLQAENKIIEKNNLLKAGKNLIFFWSPNCSFCEQFYKSLQTRNIAINQIWIPITDNFEDIQPYINEHNIKYPQLVTKHSEIFTSIENFNVKRVPEIWIVNNKGDVLYNQIGSEIHDELLNAISIEKIQNN